MKVVEPTVVKMNNSERGPEALFRIEVDGMVLMLERDMAHRLKDRLEEALTGRFDWGGAIQ